MSAKIALRLDFDALQLRKLARRCSDTRQTRRLLALVAVYDGMSRAIRPRSGAWIVKHYETGT